MSDRADPVGSRAPAGRPVGAVARALAVLDELAEQPGGLGVNELARRIAVNPSTASRLLGTLEQGGLVERSPGGPYRLGLRLVGLADMVLARLDVRELARPRLRELAAGTGETATLSVPGSPDAVTVDYVAGGASVVSVARVGRPSVAHATAAGKVMLAFGASASGGAVLASRAPLEAFTARTIVDPAVLREQVARVAEHGWADAEGEREEDLNAIAAPVFGHGGPLVAILGLQGPAARFPMPDRAAAVPLLLTVAGELSVALAGRQLQG